MPNINKLVESGREFLIVYVQQCVIRLMILHYQVKVPMARYMGADQSIGTLVNMSNNVMDEGGIWEARKESSASPQNNETQKQLSNHIPLYKLIMQPLPQHRRASFHDNASPFKRRDLGVGAPFATADDSACTG